MNTRTKLFSVLGAFALLGSVSAGLAASRSSIVETRADGRTYRFSSTENGWADGETLVEGAAPKEFTLKANEEFKFKLAGTWTGALGWTNRAGTVGTNSNKFVESASDQNMKCLEAGIYYISIHDEKMFVESSASVTTTTVYAQVKGWADTYIYAFDETTLAVKTEPLGVWPGIPVASYCTTDTNFSGSLGGIAKITVPYSTLANTKIILSNNGVSQSADQDLHDGYYYWKDGAMGDQDYGYAAAVVHKLNAAVVGVTDSSVCNVSKATATALVTDYDNCSSSGRVDISTMYTWSATVGDSKANHTYAEIVAQLRTISTSGSGSNNMVFENGSGSNEAMFPIIAASSVTLVALGGFFFLRKRKQF